MKNKKFTNSVSDRKLRWKNRFRIQILLRRVDKKMFTLFKDNDRLFNLIGKKD